MSDSAHLHSNGRDTTSHLEIGFKFAPKGFEPKYKQAGLGLGRGQDIDIDAMEPNQQLHSYAVLKQNTKILSYEPHLHAPGTRMCLEAIWGSNIETLNCVGYDHNWVRGYHLHGRCGAAPPEGDDRAHDRLRGQFTVEQERARSAQLDRAPGTDP